ncbi:codanin-1-like [Glandiceps talaboti]
MAAVVELMLEGKILPKHVISWLKGEKNQVEYTFDIEFTAQYQLLNDGNQQTEFVPYLLNFLREQSSELISSSLSTGASPVKTPRSLGKNPSFSYKSTGNYKSKSTNRIQLFSSPRRQEPSPKQEVNVPQSTKSETSPRCELISTPSCAKPTASPSPRHCQTTPKSSSKSEDSLSPPCGYSPYSPYFEGTRHKNSPSHRPTQKGGDLHGTSPEILQTKGHKKKGATYNYEDKQKGYQQYQPSPGTRRKSGNKRRSNPDHKERVKEVFPEYKPTPHLQLDNLEDFPPIGGSSSSKATASRRIKPTPVTGERLQNRTQKCFTTTPVVAQNTEVSFSVKPIQSTQFMSPQKMRNCNHTESANSPKSTSKSLDEERELLRIERQKQRLENTSTVFSPSKTDSGGGGGGGGGILQSPPPIQLTPTKPPVTSLFKAELKEARKDKVAYISQLNILAEMYSSCVQELLVPNIVVELYFVIQLLTVKGVGEDIISENTADVDDINYLHSLHNCVYFAVAVLSRLQRLLVYLDKATLRLLSDNPRVSQFSDTLKIKLLELSEASCSAGYMSKNTTIVPGVAFQADTDNRTNFPNDRSFHLFKKQRDTFYELVREWEDNHHKPGWTMKTAMAHKVWQLVHHQLEFANFAHFVRLFQSQLIKMCKSGNCQLDDLTSNTDDMEFLQHLRKNNPEKLKRLQERLIMPLSYGGPSPPPTFTGPEEFFHNFVTIADSHIFNQHLMDSLSAKILQLNRVELSLPVDSQENGTKPCVTQEQRDALVSSLLTNKLLGKFLGLVVFLPYQCPEKLPAHLEMSILAIRNEIRVPLDIVHELSTALDRHQLILTLPWVIDYLSMMDNLAPHCLYYQSVLDKLLQLYRHLTAMVVAGNEINHNYILMLLLLGWLFEIPVFPEGLFFKLYDQSLSEITNSALSGDSPCLDAIDLIDTQLLYLCCPYLGELRVLLLESAAGMKSQGNTFKKITPIAADNVPQDENKKNYLSRIEKRLQVDFDSICLQSQLIENFYHNQPQSVQKTIDFVSERVVSNCKEQIEGGLLMGLVQAALAEISKVMELSTKQPVMDLSTKRTDRDLSTKRTDRDLSTKRTDRDMSTKQTDTDQSTKQTDTDKIRKKIYTLIAEKCSNARSTVVAQCKRYCQNKCYKSIKLMLSENTKSEVLKAATTIASEMAYEKLHPWIFKSFTAKMTKRLTAEVDKLLVDDTTSKSTTGHVDSLCKQPSDKQASVKTKEKPLIATEGSITKDVAALTLKDKALSKPVQSVEGKENVTDSLTVLVSKLKEIVMKFDTQQNEDQTLLSDLNTLLQKVQCECQSKSCNSLIVLAKIGELVVDVISIMTIHHPQYITSILQTDTNPLLQILLQCHKSEQLTSLDKLLCVEQLSKISGSDNLQESWQSFLMMLQFLIVNGTTMWNTVETLLLSWLSTMDDISGDIAVIILNWMQSLVDSGNENLEARDFAELLAALLQLCSDLDEELIPLCFESIIIL